MAEHTRSGMVCHGDMRLFCDNHPHQTVNTAITPKKNVVNGNDFRTHGFVCLD